MGGGNYTVKAPFKIDRPLEVTRGFLEDYSKLSGIDTLLFSDFVSLKHKKSLEAVGVSPCEAPWDKVMPGREYDATVSRFTSAVENGLRDRDGKSFAYYLDVHLPNEKVTHSLKPAKINLEKLEGYYDNANGAQKAAIASFRPLNGRYAQRPVYDRIDSVTGRMRIVGGPMILTLGREYRDIITSRYEEDGRILMVDYKSLEPRVALAVARSGDKDLKNERDIYEAVRAKAGVDVSREVIKQVVISRMYGGGKNLIREKLSAYSQKSTDKIIDLVTDLFGIKEESRRLSREAKDFGYITSFYGRKINLGDNIMKNIIQRQGVLYNYYVQSTAVDVALMGFGSMLNALDLERVIPLYVLHDAIVLDVHRDDARHLAEAIQEGARVLKMGDTNFFTDISQI